MIRGGMIKKNNQIKNAEIIDLAPTILYLLGVPLLEDMDGRILNEVFKDDFLEANTPAYQGERDDAKGNQDDAYSIDEAEKIHERLRGLGYLE